MSDSMRDLRVERSVLDEPDDAELAWRAIERVYDAVDIHVGASALDAQLARLTAGQRALLALHWTVAEVSNGGFDQFFLNSTGDLADEALAGFRHIGADRSAALLEQLFATFPGGRPSRDQEARASFLESLDDEERDARFETHDEAFYELTESELYPRAGAYVRAHPQEFVRD